MENGTHIKHCILYGAERSLNAYCYYRYRHHRRRRRRRRRHHRRHRRRRRRRCRFLQNRTEKGLETRKEFINVIQSVLRAPIHPPAALSIWFKKCLIRQQGIQKSSSQRYIARKI